MVFPWAASESNHMVALSSRAELHRSMGASIGGQALEDQTGVQLSEVELVELYSCFPVAVEMIASELGFDETRDLTVTGGMPFAGGPFNNFVFQATCRMVELLRARPGTRGLVTTISGVLTKQAFALMSTEPPPREFASIDVTEEVAARSLEKAVVDEFSGTGTIAAHTVLYASGQRASAVALVDVSDERRTLAVTTDPDLIGELEEHDRCGHSVGIRRGEIIRLGGSAAPKRTSGRRGNTDRETSQG
jgi:acetyl-CoA C-acetyltransferase